MALDVKISFSWTDYCRLCLMDGDIMLPLFDGEGIHRQLGQKIEACLQLLTYDGDPLPRRICHKCLYKLNQAFDFRAMAVASFERLKVHLLPLKHVPSVREYLDRTEEIKGFKDVKQKSPVKIGTIPATPNVECSKTPSITSPSFPKPRIRIKSDAELKGAQPSAQMSPSFQKLVQTQPLSPLQSARIGLQSSTPPSPFQSPLEKSVLQPARNTSHPSSHMSINMVNPRASPSVHETLNRPFQIRSPPQLSPLVSSEANVENSDQSRLVNLEANKESDESSKLKQMEQGSDCDLRTTDTVSVLPKKKRRKQLAGPASRKAVTYPTAWQCLLCSSYFLSRKSLSLHMDECLKCNTCSREFSSLNEKAIHEANNHLRVIVDAEKKHMPKRCNRCPSRFASNIMLASHVKYDHISLPTHTDAGGPSSDNQQVVTQSKAFKAITNYCGNNSVVLTNSTSELSSDDSDVIDDCGNGFPDETNAAQMLDPSSLVPKTSREASFTCTKCSRKFTTKTSMLLHLQYHDKLSYKCCECSSVFPTGTKLRIHEREEHGKSNPPYFRCKVCDKMFLSRSLLIQHKQTHKSLVHHDGINSNLLLSKKIETGPKAKEKLLCHRCSEEFDDDDAFMWHLYQHAKAPENPKAKGGDSTVNKGMGSTVPKIPDSVEKAPFSSSVIETPNEEKIIKCDLCNTVCRSKEYYTLHMARHAGKTKSHFPCIGCGQVFKNIEALNRHTCFGGDAKEKESCLDCGQVLKTGEEHTCDNKCRLCGKVFRSSRGQRLHGLYKHGIGLSPEDDIALPSEEELLKQKEPSGNLVDHSKDGSVSKAGVQYSAPSDKQQHRPDRYLSERPPPEGASRDLPLLMPIRQEVSTLASSRPTVLFCNFAQGTPNKEKIVLDSGKPTFGPLVHPALGPSSSIVNPKSSLLESSPLNSH